MHVQPPDAILFLFLLTESVFDVRDRAINLPILLVTAVCGIWYGFSSGTPLLRVAAALLPGALLLGVSLASRGRVGAGDALAVLVMALFADWIRVLVSLFLGLAFSAGWAGYLLAVKKKGRRTAFPFLPFLAAGHAAALLCGM